MKAVVLGASAATLVAIAGLRLFVWAVSGGPEEQAYHAELNARRGLKAA